MAVQTKQYPFSARLTAYFHLRSQIEQIPRTALFQLATGIVLAWSPQGSEVLVDSRAYKLNAARLNPAQIALCPVHSGLPLQLYRLSQELFMARLPEEILLEMATQAFVLACFPEDAQVTWFGAPKPIS
jgi:hypothetical protein